MSNPSLFRPLNDSEKTLISALVRRRKLGEFDNRSSDYDVLRVSYENMQGGFCVCILIFDPSLDAHSPVSPEERCLYRGASRRSYKDSRNQLRGEMMAFRRAVLYSHPITIHNLSSI